MGSAQLPHVVNYPGCLFGNSFPPEKAERYTRQNASTVGYRCHCGVRCVFECTSMIQAMIQVVYLYMHNCITTVFHTHEIDIDLSGQAV